MLQFTEPVKFLGTETKTGTSIRTGKPYEVKEAKFFVNDLGRVIIPVKGSPKFPDVGQSVQLRLSVDQGSYQSLRVIYDENTQFTPVK